MKKLVSILIITVAFALNSTAQVPPPSADDSIPPPTVKEIPPPPSADVVVDTSTAEIVEAPEDILSFVEMMPEFPGGTSALYEYLAKTLRYPAEARKNGIEGKVIIKFVVEEDGTLSHLQVIRHPGYGTAEEAIRVVKGMPAWKPGKQNGKFVKVWYTLPLAFKLSSK